MAGGAAIPVAAADPGHSRGGGDSHRGGGDSHRGGGDSHRGGGGGGDSRHGGSGGSDSRHGGGGGGDSRRGGDGGRDRDGGYRQSHGDRDDYRRGDATGPHRRDGPGGNWRDGRDPSPPVDEDTSGSDDYVVQPSLAGRPGSPSVAAPSLAAPSVAAPSVAAPSLAAPSLAAPDDTALPEVSTPPAADTGGSVSGGAAVTFPDGLPFRAPTVTVGDGRTPGILSWRRDAAGATRRPDAVPADLVDATVAPAVEAPSPPPPPVPQPQPPAIRLDLAPPWQRTAASMWAAAAEPRPHGGLAFGIAGLILAPLAGIGLGYRHARASRAADELVER